MLSTSTKLNESWEIVLFCGVRLHCFGVNISIPDAVRYIFVSNHEAKYVLNKSMYSWSIEFNQLTMEQLDDEL